MQAEYVDNNESLFIKLKNLYIILYIDKVHSSIILHNFFINLTSKSCIFVECSLKIIF